MLTSYSDGSLPLLALGIVAIYSPCVTIVTRSVIRQPITPLERLRKFPVYLKVQGIL